jgi:hypothetical protein
MEVIGQRHSHSRFTAGKEPRNALNRMLGGPQSGSGRFGEETHPLSLPKFEPRTANPVAYFFKICNCTI